MRIISISLLLFVIILSASAQQINSRYNFSQKESSKYQKYVNNYFNILDKYRNQGDLKQIPKYDRPDLAAEHDFIMTVDPALGYVPYERKEAAYNYAKLLLSEKSAIPNVQWTERGPNNIGGRTRALMFDPNDSQHKKVWAGGVSGGLWYNSDITSVASQWQSVDDFWANIATTSIAYDPSNTDIFYVGTGEGWSSKMARGNGIWKTTDGGNTWNRLTSTTNGDFNYNQKIVVTSAGRVIVATEAGIYTSDDGGANWTEKLTGFFSDLEIAANGDVYAGHGKYGVSGDLFKSTDNGTNWTSIMPSGGSPERIEIACAPSNSQILYVVASNGTNVEWFKKSDDAGATWSDITIPMYLDQGCSESTSDFTRGQAWYDLILTVNPTDEDEIYAGGIDIHRSTDGGNNWESITYWTGGCATYVHADQHAMSFRPGSSNQAVVGCDGGVFYADDISNNSFNARNKEYNVTQYYACAQKNEAASNYFLAGAQDNGSHQFTQPGINSISTVTGGDGAFCFIDQNNSDIQITSYVYSNYYISTNGGSSFGTLTSDNTGGFINPCDYDSETQTLYANYGVDNLFIIPISGGSFDVAITNGLSGNSASHIKVSPYSSNVLFIGTYGGNIFRITDANNSPTSQDIDPNNTLPDGYISSIDFAGDENHLLITFSNYGLTSVWQTQDGGNTWVSKEGNLPDIPVRWCLIDPENTNRVLLATEVGVWSVNDISVANPEWEPSVVGLANVRCDMLKYRTSDKLVAVATYGRGLFTSDVFGDAKPIAAFEANTTIACTQDTIFFTDYTTKSPDTWEWSFAPSTVSFVNGTNANSQNPNVIFNAQGDYSVTLYAYNLTDGDTLVKTDYITVSSTCNYIMGNETTYTCDAMFYDPGYDASYANNQDFVHTFYPSSPGAVIKADFNSFDVESASNCIYDYLEIYDSEDASSNLIGQYCGTTSPGVITATNPTGALTFVFHSDGGVVRSGWEAVITCEASGNPPVSDFTANNTTICLGNNVNFTDNSTGLPNAWTWTFSPTTVTYINGTDANSQNPQVEFNQTGNYSVTLYVENINGNDTKTINNYITVNELSVVPTGTGAEACYGTPETMTAVGTNIKWYNSTQTTVLSNGNSYTPSNLPVNTYTYYITQNTNGCESDFVPVTYIVNETAIANFTYIENGLSVDFTNTSQNANTYLWDFGDSNTSTDENPTHVYSIAGNYTVQLTANNSNDCNDIKITDIDVVTGVSDLVYGEYKIYPNPTNGIVNINFKSEIPNSLILLDFTGKQIIEVKNLNKNNSFDFSTYTAGIYLLKFKFDDKISTNKFVIK